ncbi:MAG: hypothetical protein HWE39_10915 [Oceanospirillaceae bacterium]|nr:hypothetical protein [Oceanospirillaceae bacterium]
MLKQFSAFLAWLSGSLAGIGAVLYALGFIATYAADQLLGISFAFSSRDPVFYMGRGASLIMRTLIIAVWPLLALVVLAASARWLSKRLAIAQRAGNGTQHWVSAIAAPAASLAMMALALLELGIVVPALDVPSLLFLDIADFEQACLTANALEAAVLSQKGPELSIWFSWLALCAGGVAGLGCLARSSLSREGQAVWLSVAGLAGFLTLTLVPIGYGLLAVRVSAPEIWITPPQNENAGPVRLLSRSADGILVWMEEKRVVQWVSNHLIDTLTVGPRQPLIMNSCSNFKHSLEDGS